MLSKKMLCSCFSEAEPEGKHPNPSPRYFPLILASHFVLNSAGCNSQKIAVYRNLLEDTMQELILEVAGKQLSIVKDCFCFPPPPVSIATFCNDSTSRIITIIIVISSDYYCWLLSSTSFWLSVSHIFILNTWPLGSVFSTVEKWRKEKECKSQEITTEQLSYIRFIFFFLLFSYSHQIIVILLACQGTKIFVVLLLLICF